MEKKYSKIAEIIDAYKRCIEQVNREWIDKHDDTITEFENNCLPHGSGFDSGCKINRELTNINKLVIDTSYHCMNEMGSYDGWMDFQVIITPAFSGIDIRFSGQTKNKREYDKYWLSSVDYFYDCFYE